MVALLCWAGLELRKRQLAKYVPLKDALASFNATAADDPVGGLEPRLAEHEVIAAVQRQLPMLASRNQQVYAIYKRIVDTRTIPRDAYFNSMRGYTRGGTTRRVWWVNLEVTTDPDAGLGFGLRVRENNNPRAAVTPDTQPIGVR